jgi:hypothetical protein
MAIAALVTFAAWLSGPFIGNPLLFAAGETPYLPKAARAGTPKSRLSERSQSWAEQSAAEGRGLGLVSQRLRKSPTRFWQHARPPERTQRALEHSLMPKNS